jgi:hypothetical protein
MKVRFLKRLTVPSEENLFNVGQVYILIDSDPFVVLFRNDECWYGTLKHIEDYIKQGRWEEVTEQVWKTK